jgi:tRNA(Ile2) C34 agmatinyltransferase TiaS
MTTAPDAPAPAPVNSACWPQCRDGLRPAAGRADLECPRCGASYPAKDRVPEARTIDTESLSKP